MAITKCSFEEIVKDFINRDKRPYGKLLTLSRYDIIFDARFYNELVKANGVGAKLACEEVSLDDKALFSHFGFESFESMDCSDYEGADIIRDLNNPDIPEEYRERYDCVIDAGTMEHVFNIPNALECVYKMLKIGGTFKLFMRSCGMRQI